MEAGKPELEIIYALGSNTGKVRDHNEDYVTVQDPGQPEQRQQGVLFIVADGMGGYQAGEVASESAAKVTISEYYATPVDDVSARLRSAIQAANVDIYQKAQANAAHSGMGTTIVAALVIGHQVYIASVGDSRAYLARDNAITQITVDHSLVGEQVEAGILTKEQAKAHPQRNVITRAVGSNPTVQVDTFQGELQAGDVILLCSDGLTEHVAEDVLLSTVTHYDPEQAVPHLIELARDGGGTDNISTIVLRARDARDSSGVHAAAMPPADKSGIHTARSLPGELAPSPLPAQPAARPTKLPVLWMAISLLVAVALIGGVAGTAWVIGNLSKYIATATPIPTGEIITSMTPAPGVMGATATQVAMPTATIASTPTPKPVDVGLPTLAATPTTEATLAPTACPGGQIWDGAECVCPPDQPDWLNGRCWPKGQGGGGDSTSDPTQEPTSPPR
ncbi:MAG: Stp1/IreP family PP2C-type Ser/Thr phosphatase [Thermoflexales bacterium]|nr:Stp1/IreP family PP2C-type Ser/Thr phosphatase [Thermoflexales bacterium]